MDGTTGWDVNIDGFAHIGLYPDFLQDLRNEGVSFEYMTPLFDSAGRALDGHLRPEAVRGQALEHRPRHARERLTPEGALFGAAGG